MVKLHPGFRWGPFTFRVPFYHTRFEWSEFTQGVIVAGTTGLALAPILQGPLGLNFEEAIGFIFLSSMLISSSGILFGEPFAPGWITPAFPLVLVWVVMDNEAYPTPEAKFQMLAASSICFAVLVLVLGLTGLGRKLIEWLPPALKGGIVLGAAMAALNEVFIREDRLLQSPWATSSALIVCLVLTFSVHIGALKERFKVVAFIASLGLLPGFIAAAVIGWLAGEFTYNVEGGFLIPPFGDLMAKVSPFSIGWAPLSMWGPAIVIALMGYVILFGDIITGIEVIRTAEKARPDEKIDVNLNRTHFSLSVRNLIMAFTCPFFPTQGILWTGRARHHRAALGGGEEGDGIALQWHLVLLRLRHSAAVHLQTYHHRPAAAFRRRPQSDPCAHRLRLRLCGHGPAEDAY